MFDLLRGPHVTLLGFGERWQPVIEACAARFVEKSKGYVLVEAAGDPRHHVDTEGHARAAYGADTLFVVRPDNYVGLATDKADAAAVIDYLAGILG